MTQILITGQAMTEAKIKGRKPSFSRGFLSRLRNDTSGATAVIVAVSFLPMMLMIGGGLDVSRSFLIKSRLQQACDAGVLAGRKAMVGTTFPTAAETQAQNFFKNNFPTGAFGTTNILFTPTKDSDNQITGTASARINMTMMQLAGYNNLDINVRCDAKLEVGNTDVMMVLDVTGSMTTSFGTGTRLSTMKSAVTDFYNVLGPGDSTFGRIRYGVVPYGQNANVGYSLPSSYMIGGTGSDTWNYQTRVANMTTPDYVGTPGAPTALADEIYGSAISASRCGRYGTNTAFSGFAGGSNPEVSGGPAPAATTAVAYSNNATAGVDWGWSGAAVTSGTNRTCRRHRTQTITTYTIAGYTFTDWTYRQASIEVSGFASGSSVNLYTSNSAPTGRVPGSGQYDMRSLLSTAGSTVTGGTGSTWAGCIEERDTINTITATTPISSVPTGALDLDISLLPTDDASTWRPAWPKMIYNRNTLADATSGSSISDNGCPADRARKLMQYASITSAPTEDGSLSSFQSYINGLTTTGGTIHDVGFVWGARFLSGQGIFASENPNTWNGQPVSRHIIFLTDGQINSQPNSYTYQGINQLDQRFAPRDTSWNDLNIVHNRRMRIACEQAKAQNMSIWVVIVDEGVASDYPDLLACASSADQFKFADDATALNTAFQQIAAKIASLRLSQ
jgi:Flp pilus assembly protein TadG